MEEQKDQNMDKEKFPVPKYYADVCDNKPLEYSSYSDTIPYGYY